MEENNRFGRRLKTLRREKGWTLARLAEEAATSQPHLSRILPLRWSKLSSKWNSRRCNKISR